MFVSADIVAAEQRPQLVVPDEAVIATGERNVVITADEKGAFGVVSVMLGASQDGRTVIMEGLKEGQAIVLSGQFLIDSEAKSQVHGGATGNIAGRATNADCQHRAHCSSSRGHHQVDHCRRHHHRTWTSAVPGMAGMTMGFRSPASGLPKDLQVGDRVSFSFVESRGGYQIAGIAKLDPHAGMAEHGP